MSSEHKRPLYAFAVVALLCAFFVGSGLRSDAMSGLLRVADIPAALHIVTKSEKAPADAHRVVPAPGTTARPAPTREPSGTRNASSTSSRSTTGVLQTVGTAARAAATETARATPSATSDAVPAANRNTAAHASKRPGNRFGHMATKPGRHGDRPGHGVGRGKGSPHAGTSARGKGQRAKARPGAHPAESRASGQQRSAVAKVGSVASAHKPGKASAPRSTRKVTPPRVSPPQSQKAAKGAAAQGRGNAKNVGKAGRGH